MTAVESEPDDFFEPAETATAELKVKRSLFIGTLAPCGSAEAARGVLARVEGLYKDANHNCWAYRLDPDSGTVHSSDGGEPSGTAGKPILAAIRQSGLFNVMIVVTRYFGGIKLGVRGLIDAYGQTASDAVSRATRVLNVRKRRVTISLPYAAMGDVAHLLSAVGTVGDPEWRCGVEVEVAADIRASAASRLEASLKELRAKNRIHAGAVGPCTP
jgi:uncharacterized YigZ family protein